MQDAKDKVQNEIDKQKKAESLASAKKKMTEALNKVQPVAAPAPVKEVKETKPQPPVSPKLQANVT